MKMTYHGVSAFLLELDNGKNVLLDPYIEDSPVSFDEFPHIDYIVVSHIAGDHVGRTFDFAKKNDAIIVGPPCVATYAKLNGIDPAKCLDMCAGATRYFDGFKVKGMIAFHNSFINLGYGHTMTGTPLGYILTFDDGLKVYHMGDTALFSDMKMIGDIYQPDIQLVPVGMFHGAVTEMEPYEAAYSVEWVHPKLAVPIHYDYVEQEENPKEVERILREKNLNIKLRTMKLGETMTISKQLVDDKEYLSAL